MKIIILHALSASEKKQSETKVRNILTQLSQILLANLVLKQIYILSAPDFEILINTVRNEDKRNCIVRKR